MDPILMALFAAANNPEMWGPLLDKLGPQYGPTQILPLLQQMQAGQQPNMFTQTGAETPPPDTMSGFLPAPTPPATAAPAAPVQPAVPPAPAAAPVAPPLSITPPAVAAGAMPFGGGFPEATPTPGYEAMPPAANADALFAQPTTPVPSDGGLPPELLMLLFGGGVPGGVPGAGTMPGTAAATPSMFAPPAAAAGPAPIPVTPVPQAARQASVVRPEAQRPIFSGGLASAQKAPDAGIPNALPTPAMLLLQAILGGRGGGGARAVPPLNQLLQGAY